MYRHILIPIDGSELAEHGVTAGLALAKSLGAKVSAIVVQEPLDWYRLFEMAGPQGGGQVSSEEATKRSARFKKYATSLLDRVANAAKQAGVSCDTIQVENEQPHQAIVAAAKEKGCDLIVMSSHGHSGLSGVLLGSVTNKVLAHPKTPVLVCY
jgi:nucleotide-binding universal stress UspA family protein